MNSNLNNMQGTIDLSKGLRPRTVLEAIKIGEETGKKFVLILKDIDDFGFEKDEIIEVYNSDCDYPEVFPKLRQDILDGYIPQLIDPSTYLKINF